MVTVTAAATKPITPQAQPAPAPPPPPTLPSASPSPAPDVSSVPVVEGVVAVEGPPVQNTQGQRAPDPMPAEPAPSDNSVTDPTPAQASQNPPAPQSTDKPEKSSNSKVCINGIHINPISTILKKKKVISNYKIIKTSMNTFAVY